MLGEKFADKFPPAFVKCFNFSGKWAVVVALLEEWPLLDTRDPWFESSHYQFFDCQLY